MAFSTILRRATSSINSLTTLAIRTQRNYHSAIFTSINHSTFSSQEFFARISLPSHCFSSLAQTPGADHTILRILDGEIKNAVESNFTPTKVEEIPDGFPFEIEDNPGERTISLRREHEGEIIRVEVYMPDQVSGDEDEDEDDVKNSQSGISMAVSVSKRGETCLEFACTAYPDEVGIDGMFVKKPDSPEDDLAYEGPEFSDLDENLQKALHKYLEIRGIKPSVTNFLHNYMTTKDNREHIMWMKNLKNFIEK